MPGHSLPLAAVGGMLVVVGMVAKVVGLSNNPKQVGQLAVNSIVGGAGGGVVAMYLFKLTIKREVKYSLSQNMPDPVKNTSMANRRWSYLTAYNGFITGINEASTDRFTKLGQTLNMCHMVAKLA